MQKNEASVVGGSEVRWKGKGEIKSGVYTVYYSGGEMAEKYVAIVVYESVLRIVFNNIVYNDKIIAINLLVELISILMVQVYMPTSGMKMMKWKSCMT
jgi:hypothetical protein